MGGVGSGRWKDYEPAPLVEEALCLDVLSPGLKALLNLPRASGSIEWNRGGALLARADVHLGTVEGDSTRPLALDFSGGDPYEPKQVLVLEAVQVGFSRRWYARCPDGCGRRVRKVYAPPGTHRFACRFCAGLQYRSVQQHDARLDLARRDPTGFLDARARAPRTLRSELVTGRLAMDACEYPVTHRRHGGGWGRKSFTSWDRARQDLLRQFEEETGLRLPGD